MLKTSLITCLVMLGVAQHTFAVDSEEAVKDPDTVSILDLNLRAHVTLNKDPKKNNGGGIKFVNHILKNNYDFVTTQEGDDSTYKLTAKEQGNMWNVYKEDPTAKIYFKKDNWSIVNSTNVKLTSDQLFYDKNDTGAGKRSATLALFKSAKGSHYIVIASTHYCIDWYWINDGHSAGSLGCKNVDNTTETNKLIATNLATHIQEAEDIVSAKKLTIGVPGKKAKSVANQIIAHASDSLKIAEEIDKFLAANSVPTKDTAIFFAGDLNNQYVSDPNKIKEDVQNPDKIKLAEIEASAVQETLEMRGFERATFSSVQPKFEGGPIIDSAYSRGLTLVNSGVYVRNNPDDGDGQNTSDHDGMRLTYEFTKSDIIK